MKKIHILLYHAVYWIYRIIHTLIYNHFLYQESWYKGAYVVQLVLMPFFYMNYALLIPSLIEKKHKRFFWLSVVWIIGFVWVYSSWTVYQRNILYGEALRLPDYIETINNLIYIWLISTSFCLLEFWIKNLKKNQALALDRKKHLLKSEENRMLNQLLSDYLNTLDKKAADDIPDKILLVADFFRYVLYNRDKAVTLKTEIGYIEIFEELKNTTNNSVKIHYGKIEENIMIPSAQLIAIINRLVAALYINKIVEVTIESGNQDEVLISISMPETSVQKETIVKEFRDIKIEEDPSKSRLVISVDRHFANSTVPQLS